MIFEELKIGKKYYIKDQYQKGDISYVTEIMSEHYNKNVQKSMLIHRPIFWIEGFGGYSDRTISGEEWELLYENKAKEVTWSSIDDCPEYTL